MRFLFSTLPGLGHFFPIVPLAWGVRAAGHDVVVAPPSRPLHCVTARAIRGPSHKERLRVPYPPVPSF
jgi:L-noviosyl transferase